MADGKVSATARVIATIELPAGSSWGSDCALDQVYRQAAEETAIQLRHAIKGIGGTVTDVRVTAILAEVKR